MNYRLYQMEFLNGIHFGIQALDDTQIMLPADTLFSALCQEALRIGKLEELVFLAEQGDFLLSNGFPYVGKDYFLPKPMLRLEADQKQGDSVQKKQFKKMKFVSLKKIESYLQGKIDKEDLDKIEQMGMFDMRTSVAIRGQESPQPYFLKIYNFKEGNGLYILVGGKEKKNFQLFEMLFESLSYTGVGGKKSSGLGRFEFAERKIPDELLKRLNAQSSQYMLLSTALPEEHELDAVMGEASYQLIKRSGFVDSFHYAEQYRRKRDLYVFSPGSCFKRTFRGKIYDVSSGGSHPVYRYAKGMFLGVDL